MDVIEGEDEKQGGSILLKTICTSPKSGPRLVRLKHWNTLVHE